jgi:hypothetical protein
VRRFVEPLVRVALRSRVGVALVLALVVLAIVGAAKIFPNSTDGHPGLRGAPDQPIITASATISDDGLATSEPAPTPVVSPGTAAPAAVAEAFAQAWVSHRDVPADRWYAGLLPYCTESLARKLADVDPVGVPADRLTGRPILVPYAESVVDATIPVDTGSLRLRLLAVESHWLVDGVDWQRA